MYSIKRYSFLGVIALLLVLLVIPGQQAKAAICTSNGSGNWNTAGTWSCGNVPTVADDVTISSGHVVTLDVDPVYLTLIVNGTLATSTSRDFGGRSVTINGTFRLDQGGFVSNGAFTYNSSGILEFANTSTFVVQNSHVYWPSTSVGPENITVSGNNCSGGCLDMNSVSRIVVGIFQTNGGVLNCSNLTLDGTAQINQNGYFGAAPIYGSNSTLRYNTTGTFNRSYEWSATSGAGYPASVRISNNTTLDLGYGGASTARQISGHLTIDIGSTLSMNITAMSAALTVEGDVHLDGTLTLSNSSGGDIYVGGNWDNAGTFNSNNRAVFFNGIVDQLIYKAGGETLPYLVVNKSGGNLVLGNDLTLTGSSGNVLDLLNGGIDLNNHVMTLSTIGATTTNIRVCNAAHTISSSTAGGVFSLYSNGVSTKNVTTSGCTAGSLLFDTGVTVLVSGNSWGDTTFNPGFQLTTINGRFQISAGGLVATNSPSYGSDSILNYDLGGGNNYPLSTEWAAGSSGWGVPYNIVFSTINTHLIFPDDTARTVLGTITMGFSTYLDLSSTCNTPGTCDLTVKGDWINNGVKFSPNFNAVVFDSSTTLQIIGGTNPTNFDDLTINNPNDVMLQSGEGVLFNLNMLDGNLDLDYFNLTLEATGQIVNASPGISQMIIAEGDPDTTGGRLCKKFTNTSPSTFSFDFPIGDHPNFGVHTGSHYTPFHLDLPSSRYSNFSICVRTQKFKHPNIGSTVTTNYLDRFWTITSNNNTRSFSGTFNYDATNTPIDPIGTEASIYGVRFDPTPKTWTWYSLVNTGSHSFSVANISMLYSADYTGLPRPTAATMAYMEATPADNGVLVRWATGSEVDIANFNLYRAASPDGERTLLTPTSIPCLYPGQVQGASYEYKDTTAQAGVSYFYWIETVGPASNQFYGPLEAAWYYFAYLPVVIRH